MSYKGRQWKTSALTLQEFLAGILLEEGFVGHRAVEIVYHQLENGFDLFLGVSRVVGKGGILENKKVSMAGCRAKE